MEGKLVGEIQIMVEATFMVTSTWRSQSTIAVTDNAYWHILLRAANSREELSSLSAKLISIGCSGQRFLSCM